MRTAGERRKTGENERENRRFYTFLASIWRSTTDSVSETLFHSYTLQLRPVATVQNRTVVADVDFIVTPKDVVVVEKDTLSCSSTDQYRSKTAAATESS